MDFENRKKKMIKKGLLFFIILIAFGLRFWQLGKNPPSLGWDEASLGYNAYSILKTGRDEHGEFLPIVRFVAFGDYKPPGYIYAVVPFVAIFDLNEFAVRVPSALAGTLMVLFAYFLVKELFKKENVALLAALFVAVSPWSVMFSRVAFEANLAAFFNLLGIFFLLKSREKSWFLYLSSLFSIFSFYTFNANRIIAPILFSLGALLIFGKKLLKFRKEIFVSFLIWLILILPSVSFLKSKESKLRLQEVSILNNLEPLKTSNQRIETDRGTILARLIHNRRVVYLGEYLAGYFKNFSGRFLFVEGDINPRFSTRELGHLYLFDLPFLLLGVYYVLKKEKKVAVFIFYWMFVIPLPAAAAKETPHALRIISILPTFQILTAYGVINFLNLFKKKILSFWITGLIFLFSFNVFYFLHNYFVHYPAWANKEWQYGYKEMIQTVNSLQDNYDRVIITQTYGRPYIYFLFFNQYDPEKYWQNRRAEKDTFGFWQVFSFDKYYFGLETIKKEDKEKTLAVLGAEDNLENFQLIKTTYFLDGEAAFKIGEIRE